MSTEDVAYRSWVNTNFNPAFGSVILIVPNASSQWQVTITNSGLLEVIAL